MGFWIIGYSRKKTIKLYTDPASFAEKFNEEIFTKLKKSEIRNIKISPNEIRFKGVLFRFIWNGWNLMNGITCGTVKNIYNEYSLTIRHRIFFTEFFFVALFLTILPVISFFKIEISIILFIFIWGIFYGGNCILSTIRFNSFINKTIEKIYEKEIKGM